MPQVPLFLFIFHESREVKSQAASIFEVHGYQRARGASERLVKPCSRAGVTDDRLLVLLSKKPE